MILSSKELYLPSISIQAEWKERGTGDCKLLKHDVTGWIRLVMRRDKTLKLCANHVVKSWMELKPNCGSDRAFVWSVHADYADEEPKAEVLAIKFANAENAAKFKYVMNLFWQFFVLRNALTG